jgi:hypothetical protein
VDREARKIAVRISSYQLRELDIDPDTSSKCVSSLVKGYSNIHRYCHMEDAS